MGVTINWMGHKIRGSNTAALEELMISLKLYLPFVHYLLCFWMVNFNIIYPEKFFFFPVENGDKRETTEVIKYIELWCVLLEKFLLPRDIETLKLEHR